MENLPRGDVIARRIEADEGPRGRICYLVEEIDDGHEVTRRIVPGLGGIGGWVINPLTPSEEIRVSELLGVG